MGIFLNSSVPYKAYQKLASTRFFVDKTMLIQDLLAGLQLDGQKYVCITRPRRFGKTVMANMAASFFGKTGKNDTLFQKLNIASKEACMAHLHQYDVIYIDFSVVPENCASYGSYIKRIINGLKEDLAQNFPEERFDKDKSVWDWMAGLHEQTEQTFLFIMDEWDAVFHMPFITDRDKEAYLLFLKSLLKDKAYVELAYMTGILPVAKYSGGSELNMFAEYDMVSREKYSQYFGFLESETDQIYEIYRKTTEKPKITREDLAVWYDGYHTAAGARVYNPRSVVSALADDQISSYWTGSGPYDEIFYYIKNNIADVCEDIALMTAGERIEIKLQGYAATASELNTKNQIYSAMVVYGLLTYEDGKVRIPNRELMEKFEELLMSNASLGYIHRLAKESSRMLKATLLGDTKTMAEILEYAHDTESPVLDYNNEAELAAVVNLAYLSARDKYRVEREDKAGKGYVDFIFYPERRDEDALILELKADSSPEKAVQQIKDKKYELRFRGKLGEQPGYTGRILAVGISYNRKTKKHFCKTEVLERV